MKAHAALVALLNKMGPPYDKDLEILGAALETFHRDKYTGLLVACCAELIVLTLLMDADYVRADTRRAVFALAQLPACRCVFSTVRLSAMIKLLELLE